LSDLTETATTSLQRFDAMSASRALESFIVNDVSTWYVRRSRDRVGPTVDSSEDKVAFYATLHTVLITTLKIGAPFLPFLTDAMYRNLSHGESVHLSDWPEAGVRDENLEQDMTLVRKVVEVSHAAREQHGLKLKQPLAGLTYAAEREVPAELALLIGAESNVLRVEFDRKSSEVTVNLDTNITDELRDMGSARLLVRAIQAERKKAGVRLDEKVAVTLPDWPASQQHAIMSQTLAERLERGPELTVTPLQSPD
jgi:isoleucyl-tRNA synthetase